jgi:excinuclease UvrABC ATPase subunit
VIALGPVGGNKGDNLTSTGTPEVMMDEVGNNTAKYLREALL